MNIGEYNGQELIVENVNKLGCLCKRLSTDEITDGDARCEDANYLLTVIEVDRKAKAGKIIQCDEFEAVNKKIKLVRRQALNEVLREELRDLFEKPHWNTGGKNWNYKFDNLRENEGVLLVIEPVSDNKPSPAARFLAGVKIE